MENDFYSDIARDYDSLVGTDTSEWADYIERTVHRYAPNAKEMLDMGCGTGKLTAELSRRGFDMVGLDMNEDMLSVAFETAEKAGISRKILWLCQSMTDFELYGTVDVTVSCLDCINHLTAVHDVTKCFSLVHNYLVPGGLFIFDVNSPGKFEQIYAASDFVMENETTLCAWQNSYDPESRLCDFFISLFTLDTESGMYHRRDSRQTERMYEASELCTMLDSTGFEVLGVFGDMYEKAPESSDERLYFVARAIKN